MMPAHGIPHMKITQPDSRTVCVRTDDGVVFHLPYRFHWDGNDREPVSVVLETTSSGARTSSEVKAFFLFGMVSDKITTDARGITIARTWKVETPGAVKLLIDIDFETSANPSLLFPGVHADQGFPEAPVSFLGEKTSYPAAVIAGLGSRAVLVFSRSSRLDGVPASIGIRRREVEDEPDRLRVEVRFPGAEEPRSRVGPKPGHVEETAEPVIDSPGSLERHHELYLSLAGRDDIMSEAPAVVLEKIGARPVPGSASSSQVDLDDLRGAASALVSTHLVEKDGVTGFREIPGSPWLSSMAGACMAVSLRRLFPRDDRMREIALRLADFSLKGQLPSGMFYESYLLGPGQWRGIKGVTDRTVFSVAQSARIADFLLMLAEDCAGEGSPFQKYFLAGQRFVDFFIDEKARLALPEGLLVPGEPLPFGEADRQESRASRPVLRAPGDIGGWELFFPLARVRKRTGRDRYKKALNVISRKFSTVLWDPFHPPASRPGRGADSEASLLAVRLFLEMRALGYRPAEQPAGSASAARARAAESTRLFASLLLPWIRLHQDGRDPAQPSRDGALSDGFARQRLLFAGYETACLLLRLRDLGGSRQLGSLLKSIAMLCIASAREAVPGTAFLQHTRWDIDGKPETGKGRWGPVDSRRLAREILHGLLAGKS